MVVTNTDPEPKDNLGAVCVSGAGLLLVTAGSVGGVFTCGGWSQFIISDRDLKITSAALPKVTGNDSTAVVQQ